jgi:hypothetical protein
MAPKISPNTSHRVNSRLSEGRSSSNRTFNERFSSGFGNGINAVNNAVSTLVRPLPGGANLSASMSDAARNLSGSSLASTSSDASGNLVTDAALDGDMGNLQSALMKDNQDLLKEQVKVAHVTTAFTAQSNIVKAYHDLGKNIGQNIR